MNASMYVCIYVCMYVCVLCMSVCACICCVTSIGRRGIVILNLLERARERGAAFDSTMSYFLEWKASWVKEGQHSIGYVHNYLSDHTFQEVLDK